MLVSRRVSGVALPTRPLLVFATALAACALTATFPAGNGVAVAAVTVVAFFAGLLASGTT